MQNYFNEIFSAKFCWDKSQPCKYVPTVLPLVFSVFFAPLFSQSVMKRAPFNNLTLSWHFLSAKTITTFFSLNRNKPRQVFAYFSEIKRPALDVAFFVVSVTWYVSCLSLWQLKSVFALFWNCKVFNILEMFGVFFFFFVGLFKNTNKFSSCSNDPQIFLVQ